MKMSKGKYLQLKSVVDFIYEQANDTDVDYILGCIAIAVQEVLKRRQELDNK